MTINNFNTTQTQESIYRIPPLPDYAILSPEKMALGFTAGGFLDNYISFASMASPLTPKSFHQASGLFLGSLLIARRLKVNVGVSTTNIYPNLYMLFVGPSTKPRKTTGLRVVKGLIKAAELDHLLLANRQTPEALGIDLSYQVPSNYESMSTESRALWLKERAFAAQRGWLIEEASHLLDSFNRDYTAGLLPLVLDLYDSPDEGPQRNTVVRGREFILRPYLSIFGCTTYLALNDHLRQKVHWGNGLWARFAFIADDSSGEWKFWPPPLSYPDSLISRVNFIATELFPVPEATIRVLDESKNQKSGSHETQREVNVTPIQPSDAEIQPEAMKQWEAYSKATSFDMISEDNPIIPAQLQASYGRLGTMLIKVAMILATFDAVRQPVVVEPKHVYRAQMIVEGWRANLHAVLEKSQHAQPMGSSIADHVLEVITSSGTEWISRRDVQLKIRINFSELEPILHDLAASGLIEKRPSNGSRGPNSEEYRRKI